jgi:hypothetical protein
VDKFVQFLDLTTSLISARIASTTRRWRDNNQNNHEIPVEKTTHTEPKHLSEFFFGNRKISATAKNQQMKNQITNSFFQDWFFFPLSFAKRFLTGRSRIAPS